ncbi:hypothetical protein [Phocaeicola faecicola]|jgi:hypothetical protein|uniref:hypothetical protein n=1 Tax=Phocaeicola faecicola TaxID=2739389 RepID=UPI0015B3802E|nr:hypothetical protein [Phocaeicola faecicola]MCI5742352.1 hypothetical protein [Bacteroides sp.]MDD6908458.1 hypothetical protein [Bacteroidaceae bacterium]MDY4871850.1 hypothetical protein [Phocaeicola faecicola]
MMNIRTILLVLVSILLSCKADMDPVSSPDTSSSGGSYQSGNLPDNIYWYSTDNIVPLLTGSLHDFKNGNIQSSCLVEDTVYYIFDFKPACHISKIIGGANRKAFQKATAEAFQSVEFQERNKDGVLFTYYAFGQYNVTDSSATEYIRSFYEKNKSSYPYKTIFFAEYYISPFCSYIPQKYFPENQSDRRVYVQTIYWGRWAQLIIESDLPPLSVTEAYLERLMKEDSEKWNEVIVNGNFFVNGISLSHHEKALDAFFSQMNASDRILPIFFSVDYY